MSGYHQGLYFVSVTHCLGNRPGDHVRLSDTKVVFIVDCIALGIDINGLFLLEETPLAAMMKPG